MACYLGLELGRIKIKRFADGEIYVQVGESIRGCDVFLIQPTSPPVNDNMMELLVTIDACKRASARSITAVLPYFGYARADRKTQARHAGAPAGWRRRVSAQRCSRLNPAAALPKPRRAASPSPPS